MSPAEQIWTGPAVDAEVEQAAYRENQVTD